MHAATLVSHAALDDGVADLAKLQSVFGLTRMLSSAAASTWPGRCRASSPACAALAVSAMWRSRVAFELKAAALATGALLATPYLFVYDLAALAVPMAYLLRIRLRASPLSGEMTGLGAASLLVLRVSVRESAGRARGRAGGGRIDCAPRADPARPCPRAVCASSGSRSTSLGLTTRRTRDIVNTGHRRNRPRRPDFDSVRGYFMMATYLTLSGRRARLPAGSPGQIVRRQGIRPHRRHRRRRDRSIHRRLPAVRAGPASRRSRFVADVINALIGAIILLLILRLVRR